MTDDERAFALRLAKNGWALAQRGELADAVELLATAADLLPHDERVLGAYGVTLAKAQKPIEALQTLHKALSKDPRDIDLWCVVAELSVERFDYTMAKDALGRCLLLDPDAKHPAGIRARALIKKAEKQLKQATAT